MAIINPDDRDLRETVRTMNEEEAHVLCKYMQDWFYQPTPKVNVSKVEVVPGDPPHSGQFYVAVTVVVFGDRFESLAPKAVADRTKILFADFNTTRQMARLVVATAYRFWALGAKEIQEHIADDAARRARNQIMQVGPL